MAHNFALSGNHQMQYDLACEIKNNPNIKEKIDKLLAGTDKESYDCVYRIISRLRSVYNDEKMLVTNLNKQEIQDLERLNTEFFPNILHVMDDLFYYDGYYLPICHFEPSIFWYKFDFAGGG